MSPAVSPGPGGETQVARKGPWLATEDETLLQLVEMHGAHDWSFIAGHIPGRIGKQCRERYFNHLAPDVRKEAWTEAEDDAIVHAHHLVGNRWTQIAKSLRNGRSPNSVKNRWHSSLKNRLNERGGEAAVLAATGAATGPCGCACPACPCTCTVACVACACPCCAAAHCGRAAPGTVAVLPPLAVPARSPAPEHTPHGSHLLPALALVPLRAITPPHPDPSAPKDAQHAHSEG